MSLHIFDFCTPIAGFPLLNRRSLFFASRFLQYIERKVNLMLCKIGSQHMEVQGKRSSKKF